MKNLNRIHLNGLRAIEAVARLGNLRKAADEMGVTPGAVSQQIQKAENQLARILFIRDPKGLSPTPQAADIIQHLAIGMAELSKAVSMAEHRADDILTVSVAPVFAGKWLVWRLKGFNQKFPNIRIRVDATHDMADPNTSDVDACIRVGKGQWPDVDAEKLIIHRVFPVCSPEIAAGISGIDDLSQTPVIRDKNAMFGWDIWLNAYGDAKINLATGPTFSDGSLCLDAAIAGQGVFLAWDTLANDALEAGQLVTPFKGRSPTGLAYWFIVGKNARKTKNILNFELWLKDALSNLIA